MQGGVAYPRFKLGLSKAEAALPSPLFCALFHLALLVQFDFVVQPLQGLLHLRHTRLELTALLDQEILSGLQRLRTLLRSEELTSELQSRPHLSYAVFSL